MKDLVMKKIISTSFLTFIVFGGLCQQKPHYYITIIGEDTTGFYQYKWLPKHHIDILKSMKLRYTKPKGFQEVPGSECFDSIPRLHQILTCLVGQLYANDSHFIAFLAIYPFLTPKKIKEWKVLFPNTPLDINNEHEYQIRATIRGMYGDRAASEWRKYVTYYSSAKARKLFNADTAIAFPIKLNSNEYYKKKYRYLNVLFLQKNGRGWVGIYCFSDDKAQTNLTKYMTAIQGSFRYED